MEIKISRLASALIVALILVTGSYHSGFAQRSAQTSVELSPITLVVTKTADTEDGICDSDCSFREAVNAAASGDTILFNSTLFGQTIVMSEIINDSIRIVNKDLVIDGDCDGMNIKISGENMLIMPLQIDHQSTVVLNNIDFINGVAGGGGAISNSGDLTISNSTFSNNFSSSYGGAIYNSGNLTISNSTFTDNFASDTGGAIDNSGVLTITSSTFRGNVASNHGGAIYNWLSLTIKNSTFYNNSSSGNGGGVYDRSGNATILNSTFSDNSATLGGGIYYYSYGLDLKNTILANSTSGGDCYINTGTIISYTNNLIETNGPPGHTCGIPVSTADPLLDGLADNGGPTQTMAFLPGSPAIDLGNDGTCESADQRGITRPQGYHCDIGAFEVVTFIVNDFLDDTDANQWDGKCETSFRNNVCTLRAAVQQANASLGLQRIFLPAGTYTLTIPEPPGIIEDAAANGDLDILGDLMIIGEGTTSTVIDGNGDVTYDRVFDILASFNVNISNVTIRGGNPSPNNGGGIYNDGGILMLNGVVISENTARGGGGLINVGTTNLINSSVNNNLSTGSSGGIRNDHELIITNSTISNNISSGPGGAISNRGILSITNSTISTNQSKDDKGGGIYVGFAFVYGPIPKVETTNVTIVNNLSDYDGNGNGDGGGIYVETNSIAILNNTILFGNAGVSGTSDCAGTVTSEGYNLIAKTGTCTIIGDPTGNLIGTNPNLGPLQDNGGLTLTHALLENSPAIDAGDNATCNATDQRGVTRPLDGDLDGIATCDIGAYEYEAGIVSSTVTFDANGGTGTMSPQVASAPTALTANTFTLAGYNFAGWNTAVNGSGTTYADQAVYPFDADTTLYAQWEVNTYTLTYDGNGSDSGTAPVDGSSPYDYGAIVTVLENTDLARIGYTFAGWNTQSDRQGADYNPGDTFSMPDSNLTLYAKWNINIHSVKYDGNGSDSGIPPVDKKPYVVGNTVTVLDNSDLARIGYTFAGWNTRADGQGTAYAPGDTFSMPDANITLYAQWTPRIYTRTFKSQPKYDGWVLESGEFTNEGGIKNDTSNTLILGDDANDRQNRAILSFGTAAIPDNAVITRVILKVKHAGLVGTDPMITHKGLVVDVRKNKFFTLPALQINDFQAKAGKYKVGVFPNKLYSGWYKSVLETGAVSSINKTGRTQLRLRFLLDDDDDNLADILKLYSGDAIKANRPKLIVQYYLP